jgi:type IV pilus biogenesis protein PilP
MQQQQGPQPTIPPPGQPQQPVQVVQGQTPSAPPPVPEEEVVPYTVISVSKIENKWNAVVGVQGTLYSVHVGDIIPADGSRVKSISSSGIVLEKKDKERKISLVPII